MRLVVAVGSRLDCFKLSPLFPEFARAGIIAEIARAYPNGDAGHDAHPVSDGLTIPSPAWVLPHASTDGLSVGAVESWGEGLFRDVRPDAVLVCGHTPAALGLAVSAARAGLQVVHLDAGLRSGDLRDFDEIDRVLISRVTAMHLTSTDRALENLEDEGIEPERIHFVGSVLAEAVLNSAKEAAGSGHSARHALAPQPEGDVFAVLNRSENLDDESRLRSIIDGLGRCALRVTTSASDGLSKACRRFGMALPVTVHSIEGSADLDLTARIVDSSAVVTDDGDVAELACVLNVPCVTLRQRTEREATLTGGANRLAWADAEQIHAAVVAATALRRKWVLPKRWDGAASDRVVRALRRGVIPLS